MSWDNSGLLVVPGSIASQLEDLSREVFEHGSQVDWGTGTHSLGIVSFAKESVDATNGELKSSTARSALRLSLCLASFATARHDGFFCLRMEVGREKLEFESFLFFVQSRVFIPRDRIQAHEDVSLF